MSKQNPTIYRKRYVPEETILLKDDNVLKYEPTLLITSWRTFRPRKDIARGVSAYLIDKGVKISKIYDRNDKLVYWYCDIIRTIQKPEENTLLFEDLLFDVIVYEDGRMQVADIGEAADAFTQGLISAELLVLAMHTLDWLLETIHKGEFARLQKIVNDAEQ